MDKQQIQWKWFVLHLWLLYNVIYNNDVSGITYFGSTANAPETREENAWVDGGEVGVGLPDNLFPKGASREDAQQAQQRHEHIG